MRASEFFGKNAKVCHCHLKKDSNREEKDKKILGYETRTMGIVPEKLVLCMDFQIEVNFYLQHITNFVYN